MSVVVALGSMRHSSDVGESKDLLRGGERVQPGGLLLEAQMDSAIMGNVTSSESSRLPPRHDAQIPMLDHLRRDSFGHRWTAVAALCYLSSHSSSIDLVEVNNYATDNQHCMNCSLLPQTIKSNLGQVHAAKNEM